MRWLDSLTLTKKLVAGFGIIVFLLLGLAAFSVVKVFTIGDALTAQKSVAEQKLAPLYVAREALNQTGIAARNAYIFKDELHAKRELDILDAQKNIYLKQLELLDKEFAGEAMYTKVRAQMTTMASELERPRRYREAGQLEEFGTFLVEECSPLRRQIVEDIAELLSIVEQQNAQASSIAHQQEAAAVFWISVAAGVTSIIAILVATFISRALLRQLGGDPAGAVLAAKSIAQGDLQYEIDTTQARPESLMAAMATMSANLQVIVSKVRTGSESVSTAASEIAAGNVDLSNRTETQAAALEKVAFSMKELLDSVRQNAVAADSASTIAGRATAVSTEGGQVVAQVIKTMAEINEASQRITDIVGVIDSIAFQTNILALNAAVEAARAGTEGRGFAVVAAEVRNLAQKSAAAAKEVKALIADSVSKVGQGTVLVEQAGATMTTVVSEIQQVSTLVSNISIAAQEQNAELATIDKAVSNLDSMTQQNAALVEEAAAAAQSLQQQAIELTETVQVFKLG